MRKPTFISLAIAISLLVWFSLPSFSQNKDSVFKLIPSVKDPKERIRHLYMIMGDSGDNDPLKALDWYKKLLTLTRELKDKVSESVVMAEMGYAIYMMGNTTEGTELIIQATRLAEKSKNQQAIGITLDNLSLAYNDPHEEIKILHRALAASSAAKDYFFMCWEYNNLADCYSKLNQTDSVRYYHQKQLELSIAQRIEESLPFAYIDAGWDYYEMGQKGLALQYFHAARVEPYSVKEAKAARLALGSLSQYYMREGNFDSALYYAKASYDAVQTSFYNIQSLAVGSLWKTYEAMNNGDSAFKYLKLYHGMLDSMNSLTKVQQIHSKLILEQNRQKQLTEERNRNLQYAGIALAVLLLLIIFFVYSHSIVANQRLISSLGILLLLVVFEFLNLFLHPWLEKITHHKPVLMLGIMVGIAAMLIPLHHKLQHWITHKLVEKNKRIKLASAKKTIEKLEKEH